MSLSPALGWWLFAPRRLWRQWVLGVVPAPVDWPPPIDIDRLGTPAGIVLSRPVSQGLALDHYRRPWLLRTAVGAEVFRFKYRGDLDAGWRLVTAAAGVLKERQLTQAIDAIVPVPATPVFRLYSPAEWLAEKLGAILEKPVWHDIFTRVRLGAPQKAVRSSAAKKANVSGMFVITEINQARVRGGRALLLDDICDSGHTLAELQTVLTAAGADQVIPFAFVDLRRPGKRRT